MDDQTGSRTGRVRETPQAPNDETDCITGIVRETSDLPKTDTRTEPVKDFPADERRDTERV